MYFEKHSIKECKPHLFKHNCLWVYIPTKTKPNSAENSAASQFCETENSKLLYLWTHS